MNVKQEYTKCEKAAFIVKLHDKYKTQHIDSVHFYFVISKKNCKNQA